MTENEEKKIREQISAEDEAWRQSIAGQIQSVAESQDRQFLLDRNIPLRHLDAKLDKSGEWARTETRLCQMLGTGFLVALVGTRGNGKTQLGVELLRLVASRQAEPRYCTATGLLMEVKSTFHPGSKITESDLSDRYTKPDLLVVDEFSRRASTDWEDRVLFELIDRRYRGKKDTILISNQDPRSFASAIGDSSVSRMSEAGGIINCDWPSFRA